MIVRLDALALGAEVGSGGQGTVHEIDSSPVSWPSTAVAKLYNQPLDARALAAFDKRTDWALDLPATAAADLYGAASWPFAAIERQGRLAGIVMPDERPSYQVTMKLPSGSFEDVLMSLEHLLEKDGYTDRRFKLPSDTRIRTTLAERLASSLAILHRHSIVASDLSQSNVLVRLLKPYAVTLIDCDSMNFQGESSLKTVETPNWDIPEHWREPPSSRAADSYKLGLAILRLFARKQTVRELDQAEEHVPKELRPLLLAALARDPSRRPAAGAWQASLRQLVLTDLNRYYPGPGASGQARPGVSAKPSPRPRAKATGHATIPSPVIAGTPAGAAAPPFGSPPPKPTPTLNIATNRQALSASGIGSTFPRANNPPAPSPPAVPTRAETRRGPAIAVVVIACAAIATLVAVNSGSSKTQIPSPPSPQQAAAVVEHHLIPISGAGEAGWILSHGGHLWTWSDVQSRLLPVTRLPQSPLFASVFWRGRYARRHASHPHSTPRLRPATASRPHRRSRATVNATKPSKSSSSETRSPTPHVTAPAARAPESNRGSAGLEGKAESPQAPSGGGGGLEGKGEAEKSSSGGLSGGGE